MFSPMRRSSLYFEVRRFVMNDPGFGGNGTEADLGSPAEARNIVRGFPKSNRSGHDTTSGAETEPARRLRPDFPSDSAENSPIADRGPPRRPPTPQLR